MRLGLSLQLSGLCPRDIGSSGCVMKYIQAFASESFVLVRASTDNKKKKSFMPIKAKHASF